MLRNRSLFFVNLGYFGHMWELYAMWAWLLTFLQAALAESWSAGRISVLTFAAIAAGALGCVIGGLLSDRFGRSATTAGYMIVSGSCALLIGFAYGGPAWLLAPLVLVWGAAIVGDSPLFSAAVTELSASDLVGTALSLQMGLGFALTALAIWLLPQVAGMLGGWQFGFALLAPGPFLGAWAMLRLRRLPEAARMANGRR